MMQKDWFPFFSMLFWLFTKVTGLYMILLGLGGVGAQVISFDFWSLLLWGLAPIAVGYVILSTEIVFDLAAAEQRRRQSVAK